MLFEIDDELSTSAIAVGDVTGSSLTELCTGGRDGVIRLYDANQSEIRLLAQQDVSGAILSIKIADANNDGQMEIVVGRSVGPGEIVGEAGTLLVYRYSPSGSLELLAEYPVDRFITTVVVTDVTGDGKNEIMIGGSDSSLRVFKMDPDNNLREYAKHILEDMPIAIGTCDVIGDEIDEIVTGNRDKTLRVFKMTNSSLQQIELLNLPSPVISIAAGDILGDRKMELGVVTHDGSIRIYRNEESKLDLFSKLDNVNALSVRIVELNADHMDEVVVATSDYKIRFYNLYMAELNEIAEADIGKKILSISVGDASGDDRKEVMVGISDAPLKIIEGLYQIIPKFEVLKPSESGDGLKGRLTVYNVTDMSISGIKGKVYWFPKANLEVEPNQINLDIQPNETAYIDMHLNPQSQGTVIIRPIVLMWTDEEGKVKQVTTPETALLIDQDMAEAAPAASAPVTLRDTTPTKHAEPVVIEAEDKFEAVSDTGFGSIPEEDKVTAGLPRIKTSSGSEESLKAAEALLDQLFGEASEGPESVLVDSPADMMSSETMDTTETVVTPEPEVAPEGEAVESTKVAEIRNRPRKPTRPGDDIDSYSYLFKVMIIGEGAVGKTALVNRYTTGAFEQDYKTTIGSQFAVKLTYISPTESEYAIGIKLQAWDVAGQARFQAVRKMYYSGAAGVILVFDVTRRRSFTELEKWVQEADESIGTRVPMICVGNKIDLPDRAVPAEEALDWAEKNGFLYMESSAKTGEGVTDMFTVLSDLMWRDARAAAEAKKKGNQ